MTKPSARAGSLRPCFALVPLFAALATAFAAAPAAAANFTLSTDSTTAQTLGSGSGQVGTVNTGTKMTVSGSTVAVTVSGNSATLNNLGTLSQTGTGRVVRDNTGVSNLTINNGSATNASALMQAADADVVQMNKSPASVTLNNYGTMLSLNASSGGAQAVDFNAITSGANVVDNYTTGVLKALEADAVRTGVNGVVYNAGKIISITTTGSSSDGIDLQANTGAQITNDTTGLIEGGRHGITGGAADNTLAFSTRITNNAGGVIRGDNGSGINLDGFNAKETATVINAGTIVGNGGTGDGDGVDVDGLVNLFNTGVIRSINAFSLPSEGPAFSEGITVGGGTITNSGLVEGLVSAGNTNAFGRGITLTGNDITTGALAGTREGLYGNAVVNNLAGGVIRGQNDSAIVVSGAKSGFTVTIDNAAGASIVGGGSTAAAIQTGLDNDTVTNRGLINGSSSGRAINLGGGNNTVHLIGGSAVIRGSIDGGVGGTNTMTISPGAGNTFAYDGSIANFSSVEVSDGTVVLSGASSYTGTTILSGGTLVLDGANRLAAGGALDLEGGALKLVDAGGANGQTFASLALGKDSGIDLGGSSLTFLALGNVVAGKALTITDYVESSSPDYAFRLLGNYADDAAFRTLLGETTIDSVAATYRFDGTYTDVTAIPEPANLALFLAGLGLIGVVARRRKQAEPA
jgi:hypothetical protein